MTQSPPPTGRSARPSPVLVVFLVLPIVGILVALFMLASEPSAGGTSAAPDVLQPQSASLINFNAPQFELTDLAGEGVSLAGYGGRTLFLNFWQTTCAPCVRELPAFAEFAADQGDTGAAVLAINFDETPEDIERFFTANNISGVPIALDMDSAVRRSYGVINIPTTFVIDARGVVRYMKLGEMTYDDMEQYLEQVEAGAG